MRTKFARTDASNRLAMQKKWADYKWLAAMDTDNFLGGLYTIVSACATAGVPRSPEEIFTKMLSSLPQRFETECSIMESWDHHDMVAA